MPHLPAICMMSPGIPKASKSNRDFRCPLVIFFVLLILMSIVNCQAETTILPDLIVQAEGLNVEFNCFHPGEVIVYNLFVRNEALDSTFPLIRGSPVTLSFETKAEHNNSVVYCEAAVRAGGVPVLVNSGNATLQIVGVDALMLQPLNHMTLNISWQNPFTSSVSFVVDVVHLPTHAHRFQTIVSSERTNTTWYIFEAPDYVGICEEFEFIITPSSVDGIQNSSSNATERSYLSSGEGNVVVHCQESLVTSGVHCEVQYSSPLSACNSLLRFRSIDNPLLQPYIKESDDVELLVSGDSRPTYLVSAPNKMRLNREYQVNVVVEVNGHEFSLKSLNTTTHDIVNANATECSAVGALNTSCSFVEDTKALGYFGVLSSSECGSRFDYNDTVFFIEHGTDGQNNILDGVGKGQYRATFFDLENNGLLSTGLVGAAQVRDVVIPDGNRDSILHGLNSHMGEANANRFGSQLCASCPSNCLVLAYDCGNPDILISFVVNTTEQCIDIPQSDNPISVVFFQVNESTGVGSQQRHPEKQLVLDPPPSPTVMTTSNSKSGGENIIIGVLCGVGLGGVLAVLCAIPLLWYKRKRSKRRECELNKEGSSSRSEVEQQSQSTSSQNKSIHIYAPGQNETTLESEALALGLSEDGNPDYDVPEPTYATADNKRVMVKKATNAENKPEDTTVRATTYVEISGYMHEAQVYAQVDIKTPDQGVIGNQMDVLEVEYAVLDQAKLVTEVEPMEKQEPPPEVPRRPTPLRADNLHALLTPAASKWYEIGLAMGFSQNTLENEIHPGNSTDWLRLGEVAANYCHTKHCWEEVVHILWKVEELELADKICRQEGLQVVRPTQEEAVPPPSYPPKHAP